MGAVYHFADHGGKSIHLLVSAFPLDRGGRRLTLKSGCTSRNGRTTTEKDPLTDNRAYPGYYWNHGLGGLFFAEIGFSRPCGGGSILALPFDRHVEWNRDFIGKFSGYPPEILSVGSTNVK